MYQITRKARIKEELQLCNADGSLALTVPVDLNVDEMGPKVRKAYEALGMAQNALQKDPNSEQTMEAYGKTIIALFESIFGENGAQAILSFYEGNYAEMLLDIFPFLNDVILPAVKDASASRMAQYKAAAKAVKGRHW